MPKMRETRNDAPMIRTTLTIDADVKAALAWLRSDKCGSPITASALLREAAHGALRREGHAVLMGKVMTVDAFGAECEASFARKMAE